MLRELLVCLEGSASTDRAITVAMSLAGELEAALVGLAIVDEPDIRAGAATGIGGSSYKQQRDEELLRDAHAKAQGWLTAFEERCRVAGIPARSLELRGRPAATILGEMERHDLTVMGRDVNFRFETADDDRGTRSAVLHRARKPVLVVPDVARAPTATVLLAYDGSSAAKRALASFAASGLARGRHVHVVSVDDDGAAAWETANKAVTALAASGIAATVHNVVSPLPIAEAILEQRRKVDAGLIVMGAYARSRLAHLIWGSVTNVLVRESPVPLYFHH